MAECDSLTALAAPQTQNEEDPWKLISPSIIPPATAEAQYSMSRFDYTKLTETESAQIGELYKAFFASNGLIFDPSLDSDFVHPCDYYAGSGAKSSSTTNTATTDGESKDCELKSDEKKNSGHSAHGAYFVVRRFEPASGQSYIVGTVGVRAYTFENQTLFDAFMAGVTDSQTKEKLIALTSRGQMIPPTAMGELKRMILHPECRGKGLGKALVLEALHWTFSSTSRQEDSEEPTTTSQTIHPISGGFGAILLDTRRHLLPANHIYETYGGFVDCGNYNGNYRADRFMVSVGIN